MFKTSMRESFRNLLRRPVQSALAILGILCGIAGVILLSSIGLGVQQAVNEQIALIGPGLMTIAPTPQTAAGSQVVPLQLSDYRALTADDLGDSMATPILQSSLPVSGGTDATQAPVIGVNAAFPEMRNLTLSAGRFFSPLEVDKHADVTVLGSSLAEKLFPHGTAVGQEVLVHHVLLEVVGICKMGNDGSASDTNNLLFVPFSTMAANFSSQDKMDALLIKVQDPAQVDTVASRVQDHLQRLHHWAIPADAFTIYKQDQVLQSAAGLQALINLFVRGAVAIAFLLGGIGVMNVMLMSASERQHEIGVFLAFGARPFTIQLQFLLESVWISSIGVVGGLLLGTFVGLLLHASDLIPWAFHWSIYVEAIIGGLLLGLLFGVYPSIRAARVKPAEVIRR